MSRDRPRKRTDRIQDGIFFRPEMTPPPCWRLLLLDVAPGTRRADAHAGLGEVLRMLAALREGHVPELRGQPDDGVAATRETFEGFDVMVGYGRSLFDPARHKPRLTSSERPEFLSYLPASGDAFPAIPWAAGTAVRGEADLALQITGHVTAAVNRGAVEVWKLIEAKGLPLEVVASFDGFGRPDGRGWLEFHDGVANMESSQRLAAIEASGDPRWMAGGTYMAFLRLRVDLAVWRRLDRGEQELVVGRDKLSGSALVAVRRDARGRARPVASEPLPRRPTDAQRAERIDPPQTTDPLLESSHIHRANQNRASPGAPAALRIFRQGYEFLDSIDPGGPELGLNFVSFQADLGTLQHVMHMPGWLADVNFGGPTEAAPGDPPSPALISLLAGGLYAVPPRRRPFPGAGLFGAS
jgi:deferrochelatase/peroxidase EfeB